MSEDKADFDHIDYRLGRSDSIEKIPALTPGAALNRRQESNNRDTRDNQIKYRSDLSYPAPKVCLNNIVRGKEILMRP